MHQQPTWLFEEWSWYAKKVIEYLKSSILIYIRHMNEKAAMASSLSQSHTIPSAQVTYRLRCDQSVAGSPSALGRAFNPYLMNLLGRESDDDLNNQGGSPTRSPCDHGDRRYGEFVLEGAGPNQGWP
ncbi:hypothetical protein VNO77_03181 [Canavalia gladiata]|uniref:Uncharacterized protein n=1 Tax=Canavalia gladiata TaxID=3824 RepID=A0AAN9MZ84_CANGL